MAGGRQQVPNRKATCSGQRAACPPHGPPAPSGLGLPFSSKAESTKWLTGPSRPGANAGSRRAELVFILPSERPFVARVPSAPEADGNFCGLNTGLRRAGLFGLAARCLPTPLLIRGSRPRHPSIHSCLCSPSPPPSSTPSPRRPPALPLSWGGTGGEGGTLAQSRAASSQPPLQVGKSLQDEGRRSGQAGSLGSFSDWGPL